MSEESLFAEALAISDPAARVTFLDRARSENPERRRRLAVLLAAHFAPDSFLLFSASAGMTQISLEANLCHGG